MNINSVSSNNMTSYYSKLSSGKRVNSAADDAAGLAISEKLESLINGIGKGTDNAYDMQNLINTAEGGMSNISDSLMRVRELSVQASNSFLTDNDKQIIQGEINELLGGISDMTNNTQFNGINVLDGTFTNKTAATSADGTGLDVSIGQMSLDALGLNGYDVTGSFDLSTIDNAIDIVNSNRATTGSYSNRIDYTINNNYTSFINQQEANSKIVDLDMGKSLIEMNTKKAIEQYNIYSQKNTMKSQQSLVNILF